MTGNRHQRPAWTHRLQGFSETMVLFSNANNLAVGITDGDLICFETASGKRLWSTQSHKGGLTAMAALPGERGFLTGGEDGLLHLWSNDAASPRWSCQVAQGWVDCIGVSPLGRIAVGITGSVVLVGDRGQIEQEWDIEGRISHFLFSSDETRLVAVSTKSIVEFSFPDGKRLRDIPLGTTPQGACLSLDNAHLAVGLSDKSIRFLRMDDEFDEAAGLGPFRSKPKCLEWTHAPSHLLFADTNRAFLISAAELDHFIESSDSEEKSLESAIKTIPAPFGKPLALSIHHTNPLFAIGTDEGQLMVASLHETHIHADLNLNSGGVIQIVWLPNGTDLIYATDRGNVGFVRIPWNVGGYNCG